MKNQNQITALQPHNFEILDGYDYIIETAAAHGRASEPDMEVGDLQAALSACWQAMTSDQRSAVLAELAETLGDWLGTRVA